MAMTFHSILFHKPADRGPGEHLAPPDCFLDLNLDQLVDAITAGRDDYDLKPFFSMPLHDVDAILWRHEIMQDLETSPVGDSIKAFSKSLRAMREHQAQAEKLYHKLQKQRWFLDAVKIYCDAVTRLIDDLSVAKPTSRGLLAFRDYVTEYLATEHFTALREQTTDLVADLSAIHYCVLIRGSRVDVRDHGDEADYSAEVEAAFERFKQGSAKDYTFNFSESPRMNSIEERISELVSKLHPAEFLSLENYCALNKDYADDTITTFDREIQFYICYLDYISQLRPAGLSFCYPRIVSRSKEIFNNDGFDLVLAGKLARDHASVVCNGFRLKDGERVIVVSGPNQGGKTTFARAFGQLHYLASLGCPVPGTEAQLILFDQLFTHFEREETMHNLRGKLQDDLIRMHHILERATPNSIIILNEIFTSTTLRDAVVLSKKIAAKILALDLLCLWVTFVDELAALSDQTVSMVSTVAPGNPAVRTYRIIRRPADGVAYAMSIAEKHRLTQAMIEERIGP
jgi:DNA mismatch repair ATPase MutS